MSESALRTSMKHSPVGWVPSAWETVSLGDVATLQTGIAKNSKASCQSKVALPYLRVANVQDGYVDLTEIKYIDVEASRVSRYLLQKGDVLFNEGGDFDKLGRGCVWQGQISPMVHQNHVFSVRCGHRVMPEYLAQYSASPVGKRFFLVSSRQTTNLATINSTQLRAFPVPLPPLPEQRKIAAILSSVDTTIERTEALIAKLRDLRTAMMQELLTKGIGHTRFKDSPLGRIPEEWEVVRLGECVDSLITYGIVQAGPHVPGGIPYIRTGDMAGDHLERQGMLCTSSAIADSFNRSRVQTGEIVCAIRATVGKVLLVPADLDGANLTQGTARIAPRKGVDPHFLLWAIRSGPVQYKLRLAVKGTTFSEITLAELRKIQVPLPMRKEERAKIAAMLDCVQTQLDARALRLARLHSLKKALMQDLLTGRVRAEA